MFNLNQRPPGYVALFLLFFLLHADVNLKKCLSYCAFILKAYTNTHYCHMIKDACIGMREAMNTNFFLLLLQLNKAGVACRHALEVLHVLP